MNGNGANSVQNIKPIIFGTQTSPMLNPQAPTSPGTQYESEWGPHSPDHHPTKLKLHVERRAKNAEVLTFREMCGESAFIPESQLTVVRKAGSGSFAQVEIAKYNAPGQPERIVAVKRLRSDAAVEVSQLADEANILRKLQNKNIVEFIGVGSSEAGTTVKKHDKTSCYMVQEFMNGGNLKQIIFKQGNVMYPIYSDHDAVEWGRQIADGLAYLHSANPLVLHRDLKLENILLNETPQPGSKRPRISAKICDFGLAVSLLDPHFTYRQFPSLPSGLASPRIDTHFHNQMACDVHGSAILDKKIAEQAEKMKTALVPTSPGAPPRGTSFSVAQFQRRPSALMRGSLEGGRAKSGERLQRNSVSVAEVMHGRVQPPPARSMTMAKPPRLGKTKTMSKAGQSIVDAAGADPPVHEAYLLTGRAGSFLYMAPEVVMCQAYNEKADVFSLGVILFELFLRKPLAAIVMELDDSPAAIEMFAYQVAGGYRHPIPTDWPQELRTLINDCWAQDPNMRPHTKKVAEKLGHLEDSNLFRKWEEDHSSGTQPKCCCIQ